MNPPSSSTSSSEAEPRSRGDNLQAALKTGAWILVGLVVVDILINLAFAYPRDPKVLDPSQLQLYFEYGRSTEAKLRRMTRPDPAQTAPITLSGWYDPLVAVDRPKPGATDVVTFYGMSHAVRLAEALDRTSSRYAARSVGAPGATANWSYGAFLRDRDRTKSRAVVLGMMAANLPMITTMSAMTWNVAFPIPYTEDRYFVRDGKLGVIRPPYSSFADYVRTFEDPQRWAAAQKLFAAHDPMYDPLLMRANIFDHSSLARLIRRAYGQKRERGMRTGVLDANGFNQKSEQVEVANAIVKDFAERARRDGVIPVIFIVNNLGYSDFLYRALRQTLDENQIPYVSSHTLVSPDDPRGYLPDSHFTDANDDRMAVALAELIDRVGSREAALRSATASAHAPSVIVRK